MKGRRSRWRNLAKSMQKGAICRADMSAFRLVEKGQARCLHVRGRSRSADGASGRPPGRKIKKRPPPLQLGKIFGDTNVSCRRGTNWSNCKMVGTRRLRPLHCGGHRPSPHPSHRLGKNLRRHQCQPSAGNQLIKLQDGRHSAPEASAVWRAKSSATPMSATRRPEAAAAWEGIGPARGGDHDCLTQADSLPTKALIAHELSKQFRPAMVMICLKSIHSFSASERLQQQHEPLQNCKP